MHMIKLYGKPIKVNKASQDKRAQDVGANLFIGNLDPDVDEKMLYDTFSNFGMIISTKITRDAEDGGSKGHGFVSYDNFNSSDLAISQMSGQFFSGRQIRVEYASKKDSKAEKHGTFAERLLAENKPNNISKMPSLIMNNPPPTFGDKMAKQPSLPPEIPLAKGGITSNLLPPPKPMLGALNKNVPNIKLPPMPPVPNK